MVKKGEAKSKTQPNGTDGQIDLVYLFLIENKEQ